jgi:hypothetical protein
MRSCLISSSGPIHVSGPTRFIPSLCRMTKQDDDWQLEAWAQTLSLQEPLPTMPLWLANDLAIPLDLEKSYEESCHGLGIA